jgi:hypothetical protein
MSKIDKINTNNTSKAFLTIAKSIKFQGKKLARLSSKTILMTKNVAKPKQMKLIHTRTLNKISSQHSKANNSKKTSSMTIILSPDNSKKAKESLFINLTIITSMRI